LASAANEELQNISNTKKGILAYVSIQLPSMLSYTRRLYQ
jgi:hypothetical protein